MSFFFFSSRRRHTRWTGDWSSDVCSSDLVQGVVAQQARRKFLEDTTKAPSRRERVAERVALEHGDPKARLGVSALVAPHRSEERRVGKECRSRRSPCRSQKKQMTCRSTNQ